MSKTLLSRALGLLLAAAAPLALAAPTAADVNSADKELNQLYREGQELMAKSDWQQALDRFRRLEKRMVERGEANVDTALFWQAYVLMQAKRTADARRTVDQLREKFPQSRWLGEADALLRQDQAAEHSARGEGGGGGGGGGGRGDDRELAEIAVEGLINAPPERAVPLLKKVLRGTQPDKVKRRALFVLSQLDSQEALTELVEIARSGDPGLRSEAIRMLGVSGDDKALGELSALYRGAAAAQKRDILQAWMIAGRKELVYGAARDETDAALRHDAIQLLGAMDAVAELKQLMPVVKDAELQRQIVQSLGVAGDVDGLVQIAGTNTEEGTRLEAYRAIGVSGGDKASAALVGLYSKAASAAQRDAILQGLLIADDAKAMSGLYKSAKSKEEKQRILRLLTAMDDDAALEVIEQELK
ncbi:HEAT repeat domain-containing protein [Tahibacter caeni]|uniref:HEAT repeat domain-containing protein n=1 Tax=Tahibacter caeni TaxID=1453545 RepID=UPI002148F5B5|nr:HEAT repeat domain-containing protein [Tahibacter caeni]